MSKSWHILKYIVYLLRVDFIWASFLYDFYAKWKKSVLKHNFPFICVLFFSISNSNEDLVKQISINQFARGKRFWINSIRLSLTLIFRRIFVVYQLILYLNAVWFQHSTLRARASIWNWCLWCPSNMKSISCSHQ